MVDKSKGQQLIEAVEAWLLSYLVFPSEHYALIAALWAINTHVFEVFDAVPYLAVTAVTKRAGKTTLLELLSFIGRNAERIGVATRTDTLYSVMAAYDSRCALFFDEAERMSSGTASTMRAMMNAGYRRGEFVWRKVEGRLVKLPCYCPKLFALIGDPTDTLRDRSILLVLERAVSPRPYRPSTAAREAEGIVAMIQGYLRSGALANMAIVAPTWLDNRDQEIWESLWSLAVGMGCDGQMLERVQRASAVMTMAKSAPIRRFTQLEAEAKSDDAGYGERVLRDLACVFAPGERAIGSAEAVRRLRELPTGGWSAFKGGQGLNEYGLADLLSPFGVHPRTVRIGKRTPRGYARVDVMASAGDPTKA